MTAAERLVQLAGGGGVAAALLLSIGSGVTAGEALRDYSGLPTATAAQHILVDHAGATQNTIGSAGGSSTTQAQFQSVHAAVLAAYGQTYVDWQSSTLLPSAGHIEAQADAQAAGAALAPATYSVEGVATGTGDAAKLLVLTASSSGLSLAEFYSTVLYTGVGSASGEANSNYIGESEAEALFSATGSSYVQAVRGTKASMSMGSVAVFTPKQASSFVVI